MLQHTAPSGAGRFANFFYKLRSHRGGGKLRLTESLNIDQVSTQRLARRLGLFDATMIVMGGIIGSGIFINPYVVAERVHSEGLILGVWFFGGLMALAGAFIYAELSSRMPEVGGQYAYIREAYHPSVAFVYGWGLLLVTQTGGMAAVAITFARYFKDLTHWNINDSVIACAALALLTVINCYGVRVGSSVQSALMIMKIFAILMLVVCGLALAAPPQSDPAQIPTGPQQSSYHPFAGALLAMVPVLFAYGGWQTACFVAGEVKEPRKNMPRGLIMGVLGVVTLYLAVNYVCVRSLGPIGLAETRTPASEVMRLALGRPGVLLIAIGIAISTLGFLSQSILTGPRVYYAMSKDGVFVKAVGWVHPRTRVPVVAIALQGVWAIIIALSGRYEQILNYVISVDFLFFAAAASCLFVFRSRERTAGDVKPDDQIYRVPGHPITTALFIIVSLIVVANTIYQFPGNTVKGVVILIAGIPAYYLWKLWSKRTKHQPNEP